MKKAKYIFLAEYLFYLSSVEAEILSLQKKKRVACSYHDTCRKHTHKHTHTHSYARAFRLVHSPDD